MKKTIGLCVAVVLVGVALYLRYGARPEPLPEGLRSGRMLLRGGHPVRTRDLTLTDTTRPTRAYGEFAGADARTLETTIWYPGDLISGGGEGEAEAGSLPLLVYSHGFTSRRTGGAYLAEHLASHGYIVAAADHPLTRFDAPDGPYIGDVVDQPGDVRFLIDRFLEWHGEPGHRFERAVDRDRIGVFGLSLGGLTATLAAFHPRIGDPRIDAAVSIAGPTFMLGPRFFDHRDVPFMMVAAGSDAIVDYGTNARPVPAKVPGALLVTLEGGSHTGFADPARYLRFLDDPDDLGCAVVRENLQGRDRWWEALGSPEEGIVMGRAAPPVCEADAPPEAMNPLHQQRLTLLAVTSFFQGLFAEGHGNRSLHRLYLTVTLPSELPAVSVVRSGPRTGGALR